MGRITEILRSEKPEIAVGCDPEIFFTIPEYVGRKREAVFQWQLSGVSYAEAFREFLTVETKSRAIQLLPI